MKKGFTGGIKGLKKLSGSDLEKIIAREAIQKTPDVYKSAAGRVKIKESVKPLPQTF